jgi:hypothetical protein
VEPTVAARRAEDPRIRTGLLDINGSQFNILAPFGGFKQSGIGRECGIEGLDNFCEIKSSSYRKGGTSRPDHDYVAIREGLAHRLTWARPTTFFPMSTSSRGISESAGCRPGLVGGALSRDHSNSGGRATACPTRGLAGTSYRCLSGAHWGQLLATAATLRVIIVIEGVWRR